MRSEAIIAALIGAGITLVATICTSLLNYRIKRNRIRYDYETKKQETKIDRLNEIYTKLIGIINLYPDISPNDVLNSVEYAPNYSMEWFDAVLKSLDYQIEDYRKQLQNENNSLGRKSDIETQISNREYSKEKISWIRDQYIKAKEEYDLFYESDKAVFDLYAGQNVRNSLVEFEVVIHNVFISGRRAGEAGDPIKNIIQVSRRNIVNSMRDDIGIS